MAKLKNQFEMSEGDEELETFLPHPVSTSSNNKRRLLSRFSLLGWVAAVVQLGILCYLWIHPQRASDLECTRQLNAWSPVMDVVEYEDVQFSNAFFQPSLYKGKPTPELEKAWSDLWKIGTIDVPFEKLPTLNKSQDDAWFRSDKGGVLAGLEVFHSIHCLDMVRQYTYRDEYDYSDNPTFQDDDDFLRSHVDHCIEALRIRLMCYADITPFLHMTEPGAELGATPDFDTQHKCKKFDKIQEWQRSNHARAAKGDKEDTGHHHS